MVGQVGQATILEQQSAVANPRLLVSAKISTEATGSSISRANAKMGISSGARKMVPFAGPVIRTTGGKFVVERSSTLTRTGAESEESPLLSVAWAVRR